VVLLRLFPSIRSDTVAHFLNPPIEGVILQCYGAGNIPSNRTDILQLFREATARGVIIISVTQCVQGNLFVQSMI
jgi:lysophospholipase